MASGRQQLSAHSKAVIADVAAERLHQQVELGYSLDRDDTHEPVEWTALLARYVGRAGDAGDAGDAYAYRRRLIQIAAIAIAAIESLDRAAA